MQEVRPSRLRQDQQLVDEPCHAVELVDDQVARALTLIGRAFVEQLKVAAHDRQRRAQLVANVVEEVALIGERGLQAVEHLVERARQLRHLVVALDLDTLREVGLRDGARRDCSL